MFPTDGGTNVPKGPRGSCRSDAVAVGGGTGGTAVAMAGRRNWFLRNLPFWCR